MFFGKTLQVVNGLDFVPKKPDVSAKFRYRDHTLKTTNVFVTPTVEVARPISSLRLHVQYTVVTFYYFLSIRFSSWYTFVKDTFSRSTSKYSVR